MLISPIRSRSVIGDRSRSAYVTAHELGSSVELEGLCALIDIIICGWYFYAEGCLSGRYCVASIQIRANRVSE